MIALVMTRIHEDTYGAVRAHNESGQLKIVPMELEGLCIALETAISRSPSDILRRGGFFQSYWIASPAKRPQTFLGHRHIEQCRSGRGGFWTLRRLL